MYPNETGEPKVEKDCREEETSPFFSSVNRINKKIEHLKEVLSPVIENSPKEESNYKDTPTSRTQVEDEILNIENKITDILDSIRL